MIEDEYDKYRKISTLHNTDEGRCGQIPEVYPP